MSYVYEYEGQYVADAAPEALPGVSAEPLPRSMGRIALYLPAVALGGISWMAGGATELSDLAFLWLTFVCIGFFINEMLNFTQRFGVGAIVLNGGTLIWFCYDYLTNWFGASLYTTEMVTPETLGKATFLHALFLMCATAGMFIPYGRRVERLVLKMPEPGTPTAYRILLVLMFMTGLSTFIFFNKDPLHVAVYEMMVGGRNPNTNWTVGRSGNLNYSWGGYVTQLYQVGYVSGVFGAVYALLVAKTLPGKILGWFAWSFWALLAFGSGDRGWLLFVALPAVGLIYIRMHVKAAELMRKISFRTYVTMAIAGLVLLYMVQYQIFFRNTGYEGADTSKVEVFELMGNEMFSLALPGMSVIPDQAPFFYDRFPGENVVRPVVDFAIDLITHPIPRALWHNKPVDPVWEWYNLLMRGGRSGREGTTISQGMVGHWYFRYGVPGVIEGGLLFGWLILLSERLLQNSQGRPLTIMFALGLATWNFRSFRGVNFPNLWALLIGFIMLAMLVTLFRMLFGKSQQLQ